MSTRFPTRALALPLAAVLLIATPAAAAATTAQARKPPLAVTSGSWGVVAVHQGASPATGPLTINWANIKGVPYDFVDLVNVSTLPTVGQTFSVSTVRTSNGNQALPTLTMDACVGATWTAATNSCAGKVVTMGATVSGSFSSGLAISTGSSLSVRVMSSGSPGANFLSTIDLSISRSEVRKAATTNS